MGVAKCKFQRDRLHQLRVIVSRLRPTLRDRERGTCRAKQKGLNRTHKAATPTDRSYRSSWWDPRSSCFAADLSVCAAGSPPSHSKDENDQGGVKEEQDDEEDASVIGIMERSGIRGARERDPPSLRGEI